MKKLLIIGLTCAVVATGCSKIKQLANITFDEPLNEQVTVPSVPGYAQSVTLPPGGLELPFPSVAVATNSQQYLSQYGSAINLVTSVDLKSLQLQIMQPSAGNFDFLDSVYVFISTKTLPEELVAYDISIPKGATTLSLFTNTDVNLKSYYTTDTVYIRLQAHINATPLAGEQLNIPAVFHIIANPLN
jgi:hypothetical protein